MEAWAKVELMGHVCIAGRLTEEEHFGAKLGRVDIPIEGGFVTQFFSGASVYRITPCTEQVARDLAKRSADMAPVHAWDYPKLPAPAPAGVFNHDHMNDDEELEELDEDEEIPY